MVSTVPSKEDGSGFESPGDRSFSVRSLHVFSVPAWVLPEYSGFLAQSKDMHFGHGRFGYYKSTV